MHLLGAGSSPARGARPRTSEIDDCATDDSLTRVECIGPVETASREGPYALATASTNVDFPVPFSPTTMVACAVQSSLMA